MPAAPAAPATERVRAIPGNAARRLIHELDDPDGWLDAADALIAHRGFALLHDHLIVALRDRPTLEHFDPESLSFYAPVEAGGELTTVTRQSTPTAAAGRPVLWGHVHVVDRVPVENRFLTFGGTLSIAAADASTTIAVLRSPAPIVRWGGHSQGTDALTLAIGAFFGRLIVPVDFMPGAAALIDAASPEVLFAAFLRDAVGRRAATSRIADEPSDLDCWMRASWSRVRSDPDVREAAEKLLDAIGL